MAWVFEGCQEAAVDLRSGHRLGQAGSYFVSSCLALAEVNLMIPCLMICDRELVFLPASAGKSRLDRDAASLVVVLVTC